VARIRIEEGDITEVQADAIVNAANTGLQLGSGVAGAIRSRGGARIQEECDRHGPIPLGDVALTSGGELRARHVIHAAAMELGGSVSEASLRSVTRRSLELAEARGFRSIAFPAIGTGVGGFPMARCAEIMIEEVQRHLRGPEAAVGAAGAASTSTQLDEVRFVLFGEPAFRVFEQVHDQARIAAQLDALRRARAGSRG
jgi:O-acetyl-ADP-ribose deacetylase (regulator of RNase III)